MNALSRVLLTVLIACAALPACAQGDGFGELAGPGGCLLESGTGANSSCGAGTGLLHPSALAISPDGTNIYVVGGISRGNVASSFGTLTVLTRNPSTGEVTDSGCFSSDGTDGRDGASGICTPTPSLLGADGVTVSADGRLVFVTTDASASVVAFARNPDGGALTRLGCFQSTPRPGSPCTPANLFTDSYDLLTSANDAALYVASPLEGVISAFTAPQPAAGAAASSGGEAPASSAGLASLFTSTAGPFTTNPCVAVNGDDGACAVGVAMRGVGAMTLSPDGSQLYAAAAVSSAIDVFTPAGAQGLVQTGCLMANAPHGLCGSSHLLHTPTALTVSPDGQNVYVADESGGAGKIDILSRNASTGQLADVGCVDYLPEPVKREAGEREEGDEEHEESQASQPADPCESVPGLQGVQSIAISGDGSTVYAFGQESAVSFARNPSTGALTETACASRSDTRCAALSDLVGAQAEAVSPEGRFVYVVSSSSRALLAFGTGASVASATAATSHTGLAFVSVACPSRLARGCRGRVVLTRAVAVRARSAQARVRRMRVAAGSSGMFAIAAGHRALVAVRIARSARGRLDARRRLRVTAAVSAAPYGGGSGFGRRLVLRLGGR